MKVILACDESGAKGYADQVERFAGEVGVFAGLFVPHERVNAVERRLEKAIAPYRGGDGKLHITGLLAIQQGALRADINDAILDLNLPCFWYAIHVAGFHAFHRKMQDIIGDAHEDRALRDLNPRIKVGSPRQQYESLHATLFTGLYGHIVAFVDERNPGPFDIEVRTDRVDAPIAKQFQKRAEDFLYTGPRTYSATGFDTIDMKVVRVDMRTETIIPPELKVISTVRELKITAVGDEDPLVVAADVLANSLSHHFHNRSGGARYSDLNRPKAISTHPLAYALDSFSHWGGRDISDRMYRHPAAPPYNDDNVS